MTGHNLPDGCSQADVDRAAPPDDAPRCDYCGHRLATVELITEGCGKILSASFIEPQCINRGCVEHPNYDGPEVNSC